MTVVYTGTALYGTDDGDGDANQDLREVFLASSSVLSAAPGANQVRLTVLPGLSTPASIAMDAVWCGRGAGAGSTNYNGNQTQILFSGSGSVSFPLPTSFTATIATTVLTVLSILSGPPLVVGAVVSAAGVTQGSTIISFGTGSGGTGTYNLSASSTVAVSEAMGAVVPIVSDWATFAAGETFDNTKDLVVACHTQSASTASYGVASGLTGINLVYDTRGSTAPQTTPAAFANSLPGFNQAIVQIEMQVSGGAAAPTWGLDLLSTYPRPQRRHLALFDAPALPLIQFRPTGFEIAPVQPPHPAREKRYGAIAVRDTGNQFPEIIWQNIGFEILPVQPRSQPRQNKTGAFAHWDEGLPTPTAAVITSNWWGDPPLMHRRPPRLAIPYPADLLTPLIVFNPTGFEIQPFQPPHPALLQRFSAMIPGSFIEAPFVNWLNTGWEVQPPQPPTQPRQNKAGAFTRWDEGLPTPAAAVITSPWWIDPPLMHRKPPRLALPFPADLLTPLINFFPTGFEIAPPQPPVQPRQNKSGAFARWDEGLPVPAITFVTSSWWIDPSVIHRKPIRLAIPYPADLLSPFIRFLPTGFEIQPVQPPHPAPERRAGAIAVRDTGNQLPEIIWLNMGWEIASVQPPYRVVPSRAGAMQPIPNIEPPFIPPVVVTSAWGFDSSIFLRRPAPGGRIAFDPEFMNWFPIGPPVPPGPQPIPPGFGAQKVISVDTAQNIYPTFRNNLVQVFTPILPTIVNVGDAFALLIETGTTLNSSPYTIFITKPDGSQWFAVSPQVYVSDIDSYTKQGLFPAQTYAVLLIPASFVDQHGFWTCFLQSAFYTSPIGQFYIGPPTMLT